MTDMSSFELSAPVYTPSSVTIFRAVESLCAAIDQKVRDHRRVADDSILQMIAESCYSLSISDAAIVERFGKERLDRWRDVRTAASGETAMLSVLDTLLLRADIDEKVRRERIEDLTLDLPSIAYVDHGTASADSTYVCTLHDGTQVLVGEACAGAVALKLHPRTGRDRMRALYFREGI